jgi:hypothetical protein
MGYLDEELEKLRGYRIEIPQDVRDMIAGKARSCGKSAIQAALEEQEKRLREIAGLSAPKLELPLVEEYTKPDGTKAKRFKAHPYVPTFLPWFDVNPCIRYDPAKAFLLGVDLAADPDRLNIQVKRKHNKLKFNFNN